MCVVADMTVQGSLSTLAVALDAAQYRLVRGVLAHNLGEPCAELAPPPPAPPAPLRRTAELSLTLQVIRDT